MSGWFRWWGADVVWKEHDARAKDLLALLRAGRHEQWRDSLAGEPPERIGSALMSLVRMTATGRFNSHFWHDLRESAAAALRRPFTVTAAEAELAAGVAAKAACADPVVPFKIATALAEHAGSAAGLRILLAALDERADLFPRDRSALRARMVAALPGDSGELDLSVLLPVDGWSAAVRAELPGHDHAAATAVLRQLAAATGSKPGKAWSAATTALLADPAAADVLRMLVERVADAPAVNAKAPWGELVPLVVDDRNADVVRAAAWAAALVPREWVVPALLGLVRRAMSTEDGWIPSKKVVNSGILALGLRGDAEALRALAKLDTTTKDNGDRKRIGAALEIAGGKLGLTPGQIAEQLVDPAGFDADGTAEYAEEPVRARLTLAGDLKLTVRWQSGADWLAKPPTGAPEAAVRAVKRRIAEAKATIAAEKRRMEGLFAEDREWALADWRRHYLEHPITGRIATRLLWRIGGTTGLPAGSRLLTLDGEAELPAEATVRLWHPVRATTEEVAAWRTWLLDKEFRQPAKQAFREVYPLTEAERATGTYSNRFAAHILRYGQTYALFKERGWPANYLGPYDGGYEGRARREFRDAGVVAVFEHFPVDPGYPGPPQLCSTDRVWFHRAGDRGQTPLALTEVPELVFTEAMRDVDLFTGVCSIALDPDWADRGQDPHHDYWQRVSFGALSALAEVRRDVLSRLLPKFAVADRVELTDRFVRVRGQLATYRVHLGSANILIEPDDRYLCVVPGGRAKSGKVHLPFEGDELLSVILSKVLLLAADDKITDPAITSQLARRKRIEA